MNELTTLLSFFAALSVATERVTEMIKGLPGLSKWFAIEKPDPVSEEFRKVSVQFVAVLAGMLVSYLLRDPITNHLHVSLHWYSYVVFGAMSSGGSGFWNSALDIVREVNTQKQLVTDKMKQT
jgi:hypothetical protein